MRVRSFPPAFMNVSFPRVPISSSVSKLSATKLGHATTNRFTPLLARSPRISSVEGLSHGIGPSFDWKLELYYELFIFRPFAISSEVFKHCRR